MNDRSAILSYLAWKCWQDLRESERPNEMDAFHSATSRPGIEWMREHYHRLARMLRL